MTIIIETGQGLENSNSLIDATELETILTASGEFSTLSSLTTEQLEQLLIRSMQNINDKYESKINGSITNETQALLFPRQYCYYRNYLLADNVIHEKWKLAQAKNCLYMYDIETNTPTDSNIKEEEVVVGKITERFVYKDTKTTPELVQNVNSILKGFIKQNINSVIPTQYGHL